MPRVLLVAPGTWFAHSYGNRWTFPAGMHIVHSRLRSRPGFTLHSLDLGLDCGGSPRLEQIPAKLAQVIDEVERGRWEIVALRCWTSLEWVGASLLARVLRRRFPELCIAAAGWHVKGHPEDFLAADSPFDYALAGDGVAGLLEVAARGRPAQPTLLRSPLYRDTADFGLDWDEFPLLAACDEVGLYLSFGCPFSCAFCAESLATAGYAAYDPDRAAEEVMRAAALPGIRRVLLYDPLFGVRASWRRRFLERLVAAKFDTTLWLEARADTFAERDLDLLAQLDVDIGMGLDSGSPAMLERMAKTRKPARYLQGFRDINAGLNARGIRHEMFVMFHHPGETLATQQESLAYLEALLARPDQHGMIVPAGYAHYPGARTYAEADDAFVAYPRWWRACQDHRSLAEAVVPSADYWKHPEAMAAWPEQFCALSERVAPHAAPHVRERLPGHLLGVRTAPHFSAAQAASLHALFEGDPAAYPDWIDSYLRHSSAAITALLEQQLAALAVSPA